MRSAAKKLTLKGVPDCHVGLIKRCLNGENAQPFDVTFMQGKPYVVEGALQVCEITAAKLLAMVGQEVERIVGPDYAICCHMHGRPARPRSRSGTPSGDGDRCE